MIKDIKFALRGLLKHPAFTVIAVVTLALGIGGSTSIFTVVNAALLRGLPYKAPDRLYHIWEQTQKQEFPKREFSYPDYQDYQQNNVFEGLAAYTGGGAILSGQGDPESLSAPRVNAAFFNVLGVDPLLGRTFQSGEDNQNGLKVTVLTYGLWQRRFGADPGIIGRALNINGETRQGTLYRNLRPDDLASSYAVQNNGDGNVQAVVSVSGSPLTPEPAAESGFKIERSYHTLTGEAADPAKARQNQRFVVVLKVTEPQPQFGRVIIADYLPAGFEIDNPRLVSSGETSTLDWITDGAEPVNSEFRERVPAMNSQSSGAP